MFYNSLNCLSDLTSQTPQKAKSLQMAPKTLSGNTWNLCFIATPSMCVVKMLFEIYWIFAQVENHWLNCVWDCCATWDWNNFNLWDVCALCAWSTQNMWNICALPGWNGCYLWAKLWHCFDQAKSTCRACLLMLKRKYKSWCYHPGNQIGPPRTLKNSK